MKDIDINVLLRGKMEPIMSKKFFAIFFITLFFTCSLSFAQNTELQDGTLVKGSKNYVYIIMNKKAVWIPDETVFNVLNLNWKSVVKISDEQLANITRTALIIKGSEDAAYVFYQGKARKAANMSVLKMLGFDTRTILRAQDHKIKQLSHGLLLIKGSSERVYIIQNDKAALVQDESIASALNVDAKFAIKISDDRLEKIRKVPLLLRGTEEKIYLIENGSRKWIANARVFEQLKLDWDSVIQVGDNELNKIPEGTPIR